MVTASDILAKAFEDSRPLVEALEAMQQNTAIWDSYPAKFADNPLKTGLPGLPVTITDAIDQVGTWHQKVQIVRYKGAGGASAYAAYLGGIDINENRLDSPGHQIAAPWHDVHARILGPAVADVCRTWDERFERLNKGTAAFDAA